ncbi:MAG TPA: ABC transporter ATP-binding protein [Bacteroidales bacterium]|nr:ABC transporter ATP-binding protein [Bacteroidales bacterium]
MSDTLITVDHISKKFCRSLKRSLWYGMQDIGNELMGRQRSDELRKNEFWAVNDVSFQLKRGGCLGLIGHNGAGKSTLLKMLNGLIKPDRGSITMQGRVGALIELGTGFNPILTGRENIYNNGAVLGFSRKEIDAKFGAIVEFSEIGEFIDTPVQNYSSGMKVRLGFSVASHLDPDILLVDEVLAVGDLAFRLKCFNLIDRIIDRSAVIFVSHSMQLVSRLCNRVLVLENGNSLFAGSEVAEGIDRYYSTIPTLKPDFVRDDSNVQLHSIILNDSIEAQPVIPRTSDLRVALQLTIDQSLVQGWCSLVITDMEQKPVAISFSDDTLASVGKISDPLTPSPSVEIQLTLPRIQLSKGVYYLTLVIAEKPGGTPLARLNNIKSFRISSEKDVWPPFELEGEWR